MKKKYFIICAIIIAVFSSIMIPLFCVNRYNVNNSLAYYSDNITMVGNEAWFEFYDLNETLPENLKIVVDVQVIEYKNNEKINEFNSKIEFVEFREDNNNKHYYTAEHFFTGLTSSSFEIKIINVEYAKNGLNFKIMDKVNLFDIEIEELVADHKNIQTLDTIYFILLIAGYIALTLAVTMPFIAKGVKSSMKRMAKFNIGLSKEILEENQKDLSSIANQHAEIMSDAITTTAKSLKKGIKQEKQCKHCGAKIEENSKFCNNCGKEQK